MKKIFIFLSSLVTSLCVFNIISNASSQEIMPIYSNGELKTCLGKSINVITAKNYGDIAGSNILSDEYYNSIMVCNNTYNKSFNSRYISGNTTEEVLYNINLDYSYDMNLSGFQYKGFTLGAKSRFVVDNNFEYSTYCSRSFVEFVGEINKGELYIPNGNTNQDEFKQHLSTNFTSALLKLKNGQMTYDKFFSTFGTHLITRYTFGDRLYLDTYCVSNEKYINNKFALDFYSNANASFLNLNGSTSNKLDFKAEYNLDETMSEYSCKITCASGKPLIADSSAIREWVQYVDVNDFYDTIVDYSNDCFVPIWEVLPDDSPISSLRMQIEFNNYQKKYTTSYDSSSGSNINVKSKHESLGGNTIEDKDRFNYVTYFDICTIYSLEIIKKFYSYMVLTITIQAKRIDDGNQLFYIYNKSQAKNKQHSMYIYESPLLKLTKNLTTHTFIAEIKTDYLKESELALVWRAYGNGSDDWKFENGDLCISFK